MKKKSAKMYSSIEDAIKFLMTAQVWVMGQTTQEWGKAPTKQSKSRFVLYMVENEDKPVLAKDEQAIIKYANLLVDIRQGNW